jgi:hypothetical protein
MPNPKPPKPSSRTRYAPALSPIEQVNRFLDEVADDDQDGNMHDSATQLLAAVDLNELETSTVKQIFALIMADQGDDEPQRKAGEIRRESILEVVGAEHRAHCRCCREARALVVA